jgi:hypothetical protein
LNPPGELNHQLASLTSFAGKARAPMPPGVDWAEIVELAERHGLASILSYQLEFRLVGVWQVPPWARERLLLTFNGLLNDNVHKLSRLKQMLSQEGAPRAMLLGGASLADSFYPHIAFRPVESIELLVPKQQLGSAEQVFVEGGLKRRGVRLGDGEIEVELMIRPPGVSLSAGELESLWERSTPARPYGPSAFRPAPVDALLLRVAALAEDAFQVVRVQLVDLREMILRGAAGEPFYGPGGAGRPGGDEKKLEPRELWARARDWRLSRALHAAMVLVAELFPEAAEAARSFMPELPARSAALRYRAIVRPALDPRRQRVLRAGQATRRLLLRG